jgi:hypothetical protein
VLQSSSGDHKYQYQGARHNARELMHSASPGPKPATSLRQSMPGEAATQQGGFDQFRHRVRVTGVREKKQMRSNEGKKGSTILTPFLPEAHSIS